MLNDLIKEAATRRDVFKKLGATALGAALLADAGFDPAMAQALAPVGQADEGGLLQRRPAGHLVRPGQAGC